MRLMPLFLLLGLLNLLFALPALAGTWGENWGTMIWGSAAAVPSMGWLGGGLLVALLVVTGLWRMKRVSRQVGLTLSLFILVPLLIAPHITTWNGLTWYTFINGEVANADEVNQNFSALADVLDVTVPNSFANSGIADANEINSNFDVLRQAVDTFTNDLTAATSATETAFNNGVASVDITSDNQFVCESANGSWVNNACNPCMPTSAGGGLCAHCVGSQGTCQSSPQNGPQWPPHCGQCCTQGTVNCS